MSKEDPSINTKSDVVALLLTWDVGSYWKVLGCHATAGWWTEVLYTTHSLIRAFYLQGGPWASWDDRVPSPPRADTAAEA